MLLSILFLFFNFNSTFQSFPTFYQGDTVSVYRKISKYQKAFNIDFVDKNDELIILKNSLKLLVSQEQNELYVKPIFSLIDWIKSYLIKIKTLQVPYFVYDENSMMKFDILKTLNEIISNFSGLRNKRQDTNIIISIGKDDEYIKMNEVTGCSPELYGRNKIACLKKFLNLVKPPITNYIGTDLLSPLINILNKPITIATTSNIQEIGEMFNFRLTGPNFKEELINKLIALKIKAPTNEYKIIQNVIQRTADTTRNILFENNGNMDIVRILTEVSQNEADIRKLQEQISNNDLSEQNAKLIQLENRLSELSNKINLEQQTDLNVKLLTEISENEADIQIIKETLSNYGSLNDQKEKLTTIESSLLELTNKIESQIQTDLNSRPEYDEKLASLTAKLNELKLSEQNTDNSEVKTKFEELEKAMFNILNSNIQKTNDQNSDLLTLKNNIAEIKLSLSNSITKLNEDKTQILSFVAPLQNLKSEMDSLKLQLEAIVKDKLPISEHSTSSIPLTNEQDFIDLLNNVLFDCRNIKTLLSNSKSSIFFPSFLDEKRVGYLNIYSALQSSSFLLQWDYYDDLSYESVIIPLPICDINKCYYFSRSGYGDDMKFYDSKQCIKIVEEEYYCNYEKETISCINFIDNCEIVSSTTTFRDPLFINDTHIFIFTNKPTTIETGLFTEKLDLSTNYILSFNMNTTFFIDNIEYYADGFNQSEKLKLNKLQINTEKWSLNMYDIVIGVLGFGLSSLILTIVVALIVHKYKKQNEATPAIRINRSRIYYSASRQQTSSM